MFDFFKRRKEKKEKEKNELNEKELNEINELNEDDLINDNDEDYNEANKIDGIEIIDDNIQSDEINAIEELEEIELEAAEVEEELEELEELVEIEEPLEQRENEEVIVKKEIKEKTEKTDKVEAKEPQEEKKKGLSFFEKLKEGLSKTKKNLTEQIESVIFAHRKIDDDFLEELEEILITSDIGVETTMDIIDYIKSEVRKNNLTDTSEIKGVIKKYLVELLKKYESEESSEKQQRVILIVGVNGVGKTTSIGKISYRLKSQGNSVIVAAADTFRAAAVEQLKEWCDRAKVEIIASDQGSDPGSVIFDAIQAAKARKSDALICDTAGRLHNKKNLMNELSKIFKILEKEFASAKIDVFLVIDATTGQNGLIQAKLFAETCDINGLILTKLDGTAKGGIAFPIVNELKIPIKYIGVGEKIDDLQDFNAEDFVSAIFE